MKRKNKIKGESIFTRAAKEGGRPSLKHGGRRGKANKNRKDADASGARDVLEQERKQRN